METHTLGYKFRIYPSKTQENPSSTVHLVVSALVFNHFLAVRRDEWKVNRNPLTYVKTSRLLTDLKKREETAWLSEVDSMALQEALRDLDRAYENFFAAGKIPTLSKSKRAHSQSYRTRNQSGGIRIEGNRIKLPKVGFVKIKQSREFKAGF